MRVLWERVFSTAGSRSGRGITVILLDQIKIRIRCPYRPTIITKMVQGTRYNSEGYNVHVVHKTC